jgi:hypothetical protein
MSQWYYLDENKNALPCDIETWAKQLEDMRKNKTNRIAYEIIDGKRISTIWIGMNHNFMGNDYSEARPFIFETMVFDNKGDDCYCYRYSTWQEAEEGHKKAVQWVKDGCKEEGQE